MELGKIKKLVTNFQDKTEYVIHIINWKQALNHRLILKKVYRVIRFNQKVWLGTYIKKNKDLRKIVKIDFENYFFMLMNNAVFGKAMENVRKQRH